MKTCHSGLVMSGMDDHVRIGLSIREVSWLLQRTEARGRGMLLRGELSYAVAGRRVDPVGVAALIEGPFAHRLMSALLAGRLVAPRAPTRAGQPAALLAGLQPLLVGSTNIPFAKDVVIVHSSEKLPRNTQSSLQCMM